MTWIAAVLLVAAVLEIARLLTMYRYREARRVAYERCMPQPWPGFWTRLAIRGQPLLPVVWVCAWTVAILRVALS